MKHITNYTREEFFEMFKEIPHDIVEIVYDYYHRDKTYSVSRFAISKHISVSTLYRYIDTVKKEYKRH